MGKGSFSKISKVGIGFQPVGLGCLDQAEKCGAGISTLRGAGKQPILATENKRPDGIFGNIVVWFQKAGVYINDQPLPLIQGILNRLTEQTLGGHGWMVGIQPDL